MLRIFNKRKSHITGKPNQINIDYIRLTFSQPSGGSRAKNRFIRGDAPVAPSSGDVL